MRDEVGAIVGTTGIARDITERKRLDDELRENYEAQAALNAILAIALRQAPIEEILTEVLDVMLAIAWLQVENRGAIFLTDAGGETLVLKAQRGLDAVVCESCSTVPFGTCLCGQAAVSGKIEFSHHPDARHLSRHAPIGEHGHICAPIVLFGKTLGAVNLYLCADAESSRRAAQFLLAVTRTLAGIVAKVGAETELRRMFAVVEQSWEGVVITNPDGVIEYVNPAFELMTGYSRDEALGRKPFLLKSGRQDRAFYEKMWNTIMAGEIFRGELINRRKDGTLYHEEKIITPLRDRAGRIAHFVNTVRDITAQKQLAEQMNRNQDQQNAINEVLKLSIEDLSLDVILTRALDIILGIPWLAVQARGAIFLVEGAPEKLVMKAQKNLAAALLTRCRTLNFGECLCGRAAQSGEIQFASHLDDRHDVTYEGIADHGHYCVPIRHGNRILGVLNCYLAAGHGRDPREEEVLTAFAVILAGVILHHETERENVHLQEQFLQSQKMEALGRLAGGIAHDFNNMLTAIIASAELLTLNRASTDPAHEIALAIREAADRAARLTRQLLTVSRKQVTMPVVVDFNEVIARMEPMLQRLLGEDISIRLELKADAGRVRIDISQTEQVLLNLVVNSRDAMAGHGVITIALAPARLDGEYCAHHAEVAPGEYVMLAVTDTGCGIPREQISHIFEPFYTTKETGSGLGLATVYGIVKRMGGHIAVYSEPGEGTTFKLYFPAVGADESPAAALPAAKAAVGILRGSGVIMVVEDEPAILASLVRMLPRFGYTVIPAASGEEALARAAAHSGRIDLLLTDVVLPKRRGPEIAAELRGQRPNLRVIFMSGYADDRLAHAEISGGKAVFLGKPFGLAELKAAISESENIGKG